MFQQAVYQLVTSAGGVGTPGATPTAGYRRLVGIVTPPDFPYRQMAIQRAPLMPVGDPAVMAPEKNPREYRVWATLQIGATKTLDRSFLQKLPLAQVGDPAVKFPPKQIPDSRFFGPPWNPAFYQRRALIGILVIPPAALVPILPSYPPFFAATWNPTFYQRRALSVIVESIQSVGGGMIHNLKPYTWYRARRRRHRLIDEAILASNPALLADAESHFIDSWEIDD